MSVNSRDTHGFNAYATLLTRSSYLAGALLLAYTLHRHSPSTPLIILYTPETMAEPAVDALRAESKHSNAILYPIDHLRLPTSLNDDGEHGMVAERFIDTWTKLRVFEVLEVNGKSLDSLCFLDADMMIFKDPSPYIFSAENDAYLAGGDGNRLCATHICVCNLDRDSWAPSSWIPENCAHTYVQDPNAVPEVKSEPCTMGEMNTGTFAFHPSPTLRAFVLEYFEKTPARDLKRLKFPDQDFLNMAFAGKWKSLNWRTNALKTWRYWHSHMWMDEEVAVLHYIVDKPWAARVQTAGDGGKKAGYKGDDGDTHSWWWNAFERWSKERSSQGESKLLETTSKYVASADGEDNEEMRAVGGGAQEYAKKWKAGQSVEQEKEVPVSESVGLRRNDGTDANPDGSEDLPQRPHGPILRKPMLGERGHGPVVRRG